MTVLYLDCFSGASGDMLLGALIDAGVPLADVRRALGTLAIGPDMVWTERVMRAGVSATKFCVRGEDPLPVSPGPPRHTHERREDEAGEGARAQAEAGHTHRHPDTGHTHADAGGHTHGHPDTGHSHGDAAGHTHADDRAHHHEHRTLAEIHGLIDGSGLSPSGKARAKELFVRLGEAEAAIHGMPLERVHLHEVGAIDSIIDIVGAVFALEWLGADEIVASPLNVGGGSIRSAHGLYPVPAPATARLLTGVPVYGGAQRSELVTPTGALLVSSYAGGYGPVPEMRLRAVGYGAGARDLPETPNVLRVLVGDRQSQAESHAVVVIECDLDDMNPQILGVLMDRLLAEGALDVFYTAVQMKKGRPGTLVSVVAPPRLQETLTALVFRETTTIGVRYREMTRECLTRRDVTVETPVGPIRFKVASRGADVMNASPEFADVLQAAERAHRPVKEIHAVAMKAYLDRPAT